jgi:hypothetical protein
MRRFFDFAGIKPAPLRMTEVLILMTLLIRGRLFYLEADSSEGAM